MNLKNRHFLTLKDYSKEEINFSLETQEKALQFYKDLNEKSMNQIKSFVKKCEEYFN